MPRPFTRRQRGQNSRFLAALARTGNTRLAARMLGVHRSTYAKRRAKHPAFAAAWDAALAAADARLERQEGRSPLPGLKTKGGELVIVRLKNGRRQRRRAHPGRMTEFALDLFLLALEDSANIRFAAASVGFASPSILFRARAYPDFAAEMAQAIARAQIAIPEAERRRMDAEAEARRIAWEADPSWPEGLTVDQALLAAGLPAFLLPRRAR